MAFNNFISRANAQTLIDENVLPEIFQEITEASMVLSASRRLPDATTNQTRLRVLSVLPQAHFVNPADTGLKQTTNVEWENVFVNIEEIATIVPIPENVLADANYDIWGQVRGPIAEAFGLTIDRAILYGENAPAAWPTDILAGATAAGHTVAEGAGIDLYSEIMGSDVETGVIGFVEEDGYDVNGYVSRLSMKRRLRGLRDANGQPIFNLNSMQERTAYSLDGAPVFFPKNGSMVAGDDALMFAGDWNRLVYSIRQDMTFKLLDQAVITDGAGNVVFNLPQQDMVALRVVMRLGWQIPNPINRLNANAATRYPFAAYIP